MPTIKGVGLTPDVQPEVQPDLLIGTGCLRAEVAP